MKLHRTAYAAALFAALLSPCVAFGAGYGIYEQGSVAMGMAGAVTASTNDAAANFYNPAALTRLQGKQFSVGGTWLNTHISFAGTEPAGINAYPGYNVREAMKSGSFFPPTFYWSNHLGSRWAYGVGVNAPFGLGIEWEHPETFTGREHATKASLQTLNAGLNLAFSMSRTFSLAAGYDEMFASVDLHQFKLSPQLPGGGGGRVNVADVHLKSGMKPGAGFNLAALWTPKDAWKFGMYYRSKVDVTIDDGDATFRQVFTGNHDLDSVVTAGLPPSQKVGTVLHFPAMWSAGAAWTPSPDWTWEADFGWTQWKAFDQLKFDFKTTDAADTALVENYKDAFRVSLGAEHRLKHMAYRFGYYFDQAAAPTENVTVLLPDTNRHGATLGLGWKLGANDAWALDMYDLALFGENRSTEGKSRDHYDGVYKAFVNAFGLSIGYRW